MATKNPTTTIPERLELEYMLDQRRLVQGLRWYTLGALQKFRGTDRQDSPGLEAFLRMSVPEILNERKLRRRLRQLANDLTAEKLRELGALLGRRVSAPSQGLIEEWIASQVLAIQSTVEQWLATSVAAIAETRTGTTVTLAALVNELTVAANVIQRQAEARASFRILQLNSQIIEEVAKGAGSSHYRWKTEQDSRVRPNHRELQGTIQSWNNPPAGGGTKPSDVGHPGSGYGCRCVPVPLEGRTANLTTFGTSPPGV